MKKSILILFAVFAIASFSGSVQAQEPPKQETVKPVILYASATPENAQKYVNALAIAFNTLSQSVTPLTTKQSNLLLQDLKTIKEDLESQFNNQIKQMQADILKKDQEKLKAGTAKPPADESKK